MFVWNDWEQSKVEAGVWTDPRIVVPPGLAVDAGIIEYHTVSDALNICLQITWVSNNLLKPGQLDN